MLKKVLTTAVCVTLAICFAKPVFADVIMSVSTDEPYKSAKAYSDYVLKRLNGKTFIAENAGEVPSVVRTSFSGEKVTIVYTDKSKTDFYEGSFSVIGNSSFIKINKAYKSDKFGFYTMTDYSDDPVTIDNYFKIYDDKIELNLRSNEFPELAGYAAHTGEVGAGAATASEKELFSTVKGGQATIFLTSKDWTIVAENPKADFNRLQFAANNVVYLINDKLYEKIEITECYYEISDNAFKLTPYKSYEINKIHSNYTISSLNGVEPLVYALDHVDTTNSYYLTIGENSYKIIPQALDSFKMYTSLAIAQDIKKEILTKTVAISESDSKSAYLNFYDDTAFEGVFVNKNEEYIVSGSYTISDAFVNLEFKQTDYFKGNEYYKDFSNKKYTATLSLNYLNGEMYGAFSSGDFEIFGSSPEALKYMPLKNGNDFSPKRIPKDISGSDLSMQIKENAYTFKKENATYKIQFKPNNVVDLYINRKGNIIETVKGTYSIENDKIKISVNNEKYKYGFYNNYALGQQLKASDRFMTMTIIAKYDSVEKDLYFNIYDGSQLENQNRVDDYVYLNNKLSADAYCKALITAAPDGVIPQLTSASNSDIKKDFAGAKFTFQYLVGDAKASYTETYSLDKAGNININTYNGSTKQLIKGEYILINNRININYTEKYTYTNKLEDNSTAVQNKLSLEIYKDSESGEYYLKLADGIYLRAAIGQGTVISDPKKLS